VAGKGAGSFYSVIERSDVSCTHREMHAKGTLTDRYSTFEGDGPPP